MRERVQEKSVEVTVLLLGIIFVATNLGSVKNLV